MDNTVIERKSLSSSLPYGYERSPADRAKLSLQSEHFFSEMLVLYQHRTKLFGIFLLSSGIYFHFTVCWVFIDLCICPRKIFLNSVSQELLPELQNNFSL